MTDAYRQTHDNAGNEYGKLKPLPEPRPIPEGSHPTYIFQIRDLTNALNAAIDRINELELKYEKHYHRDTTRIGDDGIRHDDHEIRYTEPTGEESSDEACEVCGGDHVTGDCSW